MKFLLLFTCAFCIAITASAQNKETTSTGKKGTAVFHAPSDNPPYNVTVQFHAPSDNPPTAAAKKGNAVQSPTAQTLYSHGDPTAEEQLILEYVNRARENPTQEGIRLATTTDTRVQSAYQYFNINTNNLKAQFATYPQRPPVAFNAKLIAAARAHCTDMQKNDFQGHDGTDGSNPGTRMQKAGYTALSGWGENVAAYSESPWHAHCGLNVDWGTQNQIDLGHRHNIMNFATGDQVWNEVGIGALPRVGNTKVGPLIVTQDYSRTGKPILLGVVYKDKNNNGFYDIGEGVSGVTITPSRGNYYAVSSTSGGYAIPMDGVTGSVTITASGNGINEVKQASISSANVKVDFGQATTPSVILLDPTDQGFLITTTAKLTWMKVKSATKYHVQVSEDETFTKLVFNDSTLTDSTRSVNNLKNLSTYYWRARAFTTLGWGEFSPAFMFMVSIKPNSPKLLAPADKGTLAGVPITFIWNKSIPDAETYSVEVANESQFVDGLLYTFDNLMDTTYTFFDEKNYIKAGTTYYWRATATNSAGQSEYSDVFTFSVKTGSSQFALLSPPNKATVGNKPYVFRWSKSAANTDHYIIEIGTDTSFFEGLIYINDKVKDTTFTFTDPEDSIKKGVTYYWHVAPVFKDDSQGDYTPANSFKLGTTDVHEEELPVAINAIMPQPAQALTTIFYTTKQFGPTTITLHDIRGARVATLLDAQLEQGMHTVAIDFNQGDFAKLAAGEYFVRITAAGKSVIHTLIIQR